MSGERKLSLVKPPPAAADHVAAPSPRPHLDLPDDEPEVTEEELRAAEALRAALDRESDSHPVPPTLVAKGAADALDPLALALRAAWRPAPLADDDLEAILSRAMGDIDAPATKAERSESDLLCSVLDEHDAERAGRLVRGPGARAATLDEGSAQVAIALRAAWAPSALSPAKNEMLLGRALDAASMTTGVSAPAASQPATAAPRAASSADRPWLGAQAQNGGAAQDRAPISLRRFRMGPGTFATMTAVVAMAAGVLLLVGRFGQRADAPAPAAAVAQAPAATAAAVAERAPRIAAHTTTDLFDATTPFPRTGGESARVDRIASARAADLRANRFAAWGVR